MKNISPFFLSLLLIILFCTQAFAWNVNLETNPYLPKHFLGVSKQDKHLYIIDNQEDFQVKAAFPSIHGEVEGDKKVEGDLKTPEGVYFVTSKIHLNLDFEKYGSGAYALNYPNPIDKIKQKTGHGIWIHSKGSPIYNQVTQGCVAVDLDDFDFVSANIKNGTAVILAEEIYSPHLVGAIATYKASSSNYPQLPLTQETTKDFVLNEQIPYESENIAFIEDTQSDGKNIATQIVEKTEEWNKAWEARSTVFFDFYDPEKYGLAQKETYYTFRKKKENLFKTLAWIDITYDKIYALEGTDYWVTWFEQVYKTPHTRAEGTRRLYWQKDKNNKYKIVAMEWIPLKAELKNTCTSEQIAEIKDFIESWKTAWLAMDLESYQNCYAQNPIQDTLIGKEIFAHKESIWQQKRPIKIDFFDITITGGGENIQASMKQVYEDSTDYKDYGKKVLFLKFENEQWRIKKEVWYKL